MRDVKDSPPGATNDTDLFILNPDGTETRLTDANSWVTGGSFSPDGSHVVYATYEAIYVVDAEGGGRPRPVYRGGLFDSPSFSPDGRSIAYFEGAGDHSNTLRVMNADGSGSRIILDREFDHVSELRWSPEGSRLVFESGGIWVVGVDGTRLKQVAPMETIPGQDGTDPHWSPDGSVISYNTGDPLSGSINALVLARPDGTRVQEFDNGRSGPWNPLD